MSSQLLISWLLLGLILAFLGPNFSPWAVFLAYAAGACVGVTVNVRKTVYLREDQIPPGE